MPKKIIIIKNIIENIVITISLTTKSLNYHRKHRHKNMLQKRSNKYIIENVVMQIL
jgi:hypothetical protein